MPDMGVSFGRLSADEARTPGSLLRRRQIACYEAAPADWRTMRRSFTAPVATSQIISVDVASGARRALTSGAGRKYAPKWIAPARVAYVRGSSPYDITPDGRFVAAAEGSLADGRPAAGEIRVWSSTGSKN